VLAVVQSHYPGVDLQRLEAGVSSNTDQVKAAKMIADVDLYGETR
jgi:hypothetical protein